MQKNAIEFVTTKKSGRLIEIPEEFIDEISGEFRVILILNTKSEKKISKKRKFEALKVSTKGFKFNRDDAYEE